jgi:hypothetical protein
MFHLFGIGLFGLGFAGIAALSGLVSLAYAVFVIWMVVDGILRADAEYPGVNVNRKVFWVLAMVLIHPVAIAYFIAVFLKVKRGSAKAAYAAAPPAA